MTWTADEMHNSDDDYCPSNGQDSDPEILQPTLGLNSAPEDIILQHIRLDHVQQRSRVKIKLWLRKLILQVLPRENLQNRENNFTSAKGEGRPSKVNQMSHGKCSTSFWRMEMETQTQ